MYYIQRGYVGNAIEWWRKGGNGYTANIFEAEKFTEERMKELVFRPDKKYKAWPCDYIDNNKAAIYLIVDSQMLDGSQVIG